MLSSRKFLLHDDGSRIGVTCLDGTSPGVIFFAGLHSGMTSLKAAHIETICRRAGRAFVSFDYFGHGCSDGRFEEGTITRWLSDARLILHDAGAGPHAFVGSSLGGWIALLLAIENPDRVAAIIGLSAAVDFTEYVHDVLFTKEQRRLIATEGQVSVPDCHGGPPFVITRELIEDGKRHLLLNNDAIPIACPVRLVHARSDRDIPWDTGLKLAEKLESPDVHVTIIKDGIHELSRPSDLHVLEATLAMLFSSDPGPESNCS